MSLNVIPPASGSSAAMATVLGAAVVAVGVSWLTAVASTRSWDPPAPTVAGGVCAEACGIAACIAFDIDEAEMCVAELGDLRRAGPDPSCVLQCERQGAPPEVAQWLVRSSVTMATR